MIEMQYNFPLLAGTANLWKQRLATAVSALPATEDDALRPTFRQAEEPRRDAAAAWLGAQPARTWLTAGGHHGTLVAMLAGGIAGKPIAMDRVTYGGGLTQALMLHSPVISIDVDGEGMRADALRSECQRAAAAGQPIVAVYVMLNVHNPLGCTASASRREALADVMREFRLIVIEDDAYGFMEEQLLPSMWELLPGQAFYVRGLSKSVAAATRTGFLVAPAKYGEAVASALKNSATGVSLVHAEAALSLIADGHVEKLIQAKREEGSRRNRAARAALGAAAHAGAPNAWHLWVEVPCGPEEFEQRMRERGALVSGGHWFASDGSSPRAVRLALGGELDAACTQSGVEMVSAEIRALQAGS